MSFRITTVLVAALGLLLATASSAFGAPPRFAAPTNQGLGDCSSAVDACDLETAVENPAVVDGDEVIVAGNMGTYALEAGFLDVSDAIDLHGAAGQARPVISASNGFAVVDISDSATVRDLELRQLSTGGIALSSFLITGSGPTVERVIAKSPSTDTTCQFLRGLIRDSVCWNSGTGGGTQMEAGGGGDTHTLNLRNVTSVASGTGASAVGLRADGGGNTLTLDAKNVIATGDDTTASAGDVRATHTAASSGSTTVTLANSNYSTESESNATVTNPGTGTGNQTAAPAFVSAGTGDLHQATGSPTIDTGGSVDLLGTLDFEGDARVLDGNDDCQAVADIGADEFVDPTPPDCTSPDTTITGDPPATTSDSTPTFDFSSTEAASTFDCSIDQGTPSFAPCSSPGPGLTGSHTPGSPLADGAYTFRVRAKDPASNTDPSPAIHAFTVEASSPPPGGGGGPAPPSNEFGIGNVKGKKVELTVPGAGAIGVRDAADAKKKLLLKPSSATASGAGTVQVTLKLTKTAKKTLKKKGKVKVKAAITFTPTGGNASSQTKSLKVKK
jgi:hypothetical protein